MAQRTLANQLHKGTFKSSLFLDCFVCCRSNELERRMFADSLSAAVLSQVEQCGSSSSRRQTEKKNITDSFLCRFCRQRSRLLPRCVLSLEAHSQHRRVVADLALPHSLCHSVIDSIYGDVPMGKVKMNSKYVPSRGGLEVDKETLTSTRPLFAEPSTST